MPHYLAKSIVSAESRTVGQTEPLSGRTNMARNGAGGFSFKVTPQVSLERFLVLGSENGTFYATEKALTLENAGNVKAMIQAGQGIDVVKTVVDFSVRGRTPKQDTLIFVLAMVIKLSNDPATRSAAYDAVTKVCRIPTTLFQLLEFEKLFGGKPSWGAGKRRAIEAFYTDRSASELAYLVTKYKARNGWSHRDVLRCAHVKLSDSGSSAGLPPISSARDLVLRYVVRGFDGIRADVQSLLSDADVDISAEDPSMAEAEDEGFEVVARAGEEDRSALVKVASFLAGVEQIAHLGQDHAVGPAVELIRRHRLAREHVPTQFLNDQLVWLALLANGMPMTALVRNLGKMSSIGLLAPGSQEAARVCSDLRSGESIRRSRLHPFTILLAMETYRTGRGLKGSLSWQPNGEIIQALGDAFDLAFENVQPTGKRFLVALDVSGSMSSPAVGSSITCRTAACAMALSLVRKEDRVYTMAFTNTLVPFTIGRKEPLDSVVMRSNELPFGGTDCSQPMLHALKRKLPVDVFMVFTDSETWAGNIHPVEALQRYRREMGRPAKLVVAGFATNGFSIADPEDAGTLDVVGLDASLPAVLKDFVEREPLAV